MLIRTATQQDAVAVKDLIKELGYEVAVEDVRHNIALYQQAQGLVYVAEDNNEVAGFISGAYLPLFHEKSLLFRITALCVKETSRAQGIGKTLVREIESQCGKRRCCYLEVTSGAHRKQEAHLFYTAIGFTAYEGKRFTKKLVVAQPPAQ